MSDLYGAIKLVGGITGYLDAIPGAQLVNLDAAIAITAGNVYHYVLDADSGAAESSPGVISPDSNPGTKRWVLANLIASGATFTGLSPSRLIATDGNKAAASVGDLTSWITGTTDHISLTDDGDGTATVNLDTNTQTLLGSFNGIFLERLDFTISEAGGTVTGSLEQDGGGNLEQKFSDGYTTLDCTPAKTIDLTAYVGTDAVPKVVFVYILQSAKTTIAASNSDWPSVEHCKIARLVLKSAITTGTDAGALGNQNINDFASAANGEGHITHVEQRLRQEPAAWDSGTALTLKNAAGATLATGNSSTAVEIVTTEGKIYQLHRHTFSAFDMYTTGTDDAHIVNQPTDEGGAYETTVDLVSDVTHYVDGTAAGAAIGTNKYFNLVIWGIQNRDGEASHIMINLPTSQYTTSGNAVSDVDGTSIFEIPSAFKGTGFLIARLTFRKIGGGQWTYIAQEDLRGKFPDIIAGVGITTTDHALLANLIAPADDHTQYLLADGSRALAGAWNMGSQALTNVNIDTGDIATAVVNTEWDAAFTHVSNDGSDHSKVTANETAISLNTTHRGSDGSDHSIVGSNTTAIGLNTTHRGSDGSDHSIVGSNTTAIALNTTHRSSDGSDHGFIDQTVVSGASPLFTGIELGHASDTTITRVSAGVVAVEGTNVMLVGASPTAHVHDGDTLQLDGINSDGGAFNLITSGALSLSPGGVEKVKVNTSGLVEVTNSVTWSGGGSNESNSAYDHISNNGTDHGYIDQDLQIAASPSFNGLTLSNTTTASTGVITKDGTRFIHNFQHPTGDTAVPTGQNTFVGAGCGNFTMGETATSVGQASRNVAIGYDALKNNTLGYSNAAMGAGALQLNTIGYNNLAIGTQTLQQNTDGHDNMAFGLFALLNNTTGDNNVAIGSLAGRWQANGSTALQTPNNSIYIGGSSKGFNNSDNNTIVIGYNAVGTGANQTCIGTSGTVITYLGGTVQPITDDTYYLGRNDDDSPKAWKGIIVKDTTDGKYYRIEVTNGAVAVIDLTD